MQSGMVHPPLDTLPFLTTGGLNGPHYTVPSRVGASSRSTVVLLVTDKDCQRPYAVAAGVLLWS
jgi:hypothetical protein